MKFVRFKKGNIVSYGILVEDRVQALKGSIWGDFIDLPLWYTREEIKLLAPCDPSKILCIGLNYSDHATEVGLSIPKWPVVFMKPHTSVIGPEDDIIYPTFFARRVDYEAELAVVIKKTAKNVEENEALEYVLGYTCGNDVTARNLQPKDGQWTVSKSFDTFMPLGPLIATDLVWNNLDINCTVNRVVKQSSNTRHFIFSVPYLVSYLSKIMTLLPGDVIITGTPSGIGAINPGDVITVSIDGIGELTNKVVEQKDS